MITPGDYDALMNLLREAFWNLYKPGCEEHFLADKILKHPDYIPELSFLIEKDGEPAGCILYTHSKVADAGGNEYATITFGPVCIAPPLHRQGLGRALISHSIAEAKRLGFGAIIIGGFPYHYHTYGFEGTKKYGISMPDGKFYTGIMALPLYDGALDGVRGKMLFSDSMNIDPQEAEDFDKRFAHKEKLVLPCQADYERAAADIDVN